MDTVNIKSFDLLNIYTTKILSNFIVIYFVIY